MPLFRFIFEEDAILDDIAPVEFPNHESAIDAAKKAARETLIDAVIEGCDPTEWVVRIYNEPGELIKTAFISDLLRAKNE